MTAAGRSCECTLYHSTAPAIGQRYTAHTMGSFFILSKGLQGYMTQLLFIAYAANLNS